MLSFTTGAILAIFALSVAAKDSRTFAVNHFYGDGFLVSGRMDPIVSPGKTSSHVHAIQGGSNFAETMSDTTLLDSTCTSSLIKNDKSVYWTPSVYFQDPVNGSFISVPTFYMNVYYFFEATDDEITAFQPGHRMFVGNAELRTPPATGGASITDANAGTPQPVQFTCPRSSYNPPSYPVGSDGLSAGIVDPNNQGAGVGFPDQNCDGYASPLRADIHFPSCYNPAVGLDDYKNNMAWPSSAGTTDGKQNCPEGWVHTPHIFYEVYWNTPLFADLWTPGQGKQPFVLSNGDNTGYSLHADFISGWDVTTLQQIIDNCDAGDSGMDKCPGLIGGINDASTSCNIPSAVDETIFGVLSALPGSNPVTGYGANVSVPNSESSSASSGTTASSSIAASAGSSSSSTSVSRNTYPSSSAASIGQSAGPSPTTGYGATVPTSTAVGGDYGSGSPSSGPSSTAGSGSGAGAGSCAQSTATVVVTATTTVTLSSPSSTFSYTPAPPGWTYNGCYSDNVNSRALSGIEYANLGPGNVTTTGCITYCGAQGYSIAGTEYGGQCFCGDSLASYSTQQPGASCDMACEGDATQTCGGSAVLDVYQKSGSSTGASNQWRRRSMRPRKFSGHV